MTSVPSRVIGIETEPFTHATGWVSLSEVAQIQSGHTPSRKHPEWWGGDVPWIALPDIRRLDGQTATTTAETINDLGLANSSARRLPVGTVCLSRTASVGFVTVMGREMATSQDFVNWVPGPRLRSWYLATALISSREYLRGLAEGAIHKTIYMPVLKTLRIKLPEPAEQERVLARLTEVRTILDEAQEAVRKQGEALNALAPALFGAALKGEL